MIALPALASPELLSCVQPRLPQLRLLNSCNYCYINSLMQALYWLGELTNDAAACLGDYLALFRQFPCTGCLSIPDAITWRPVLRGWTRITRQHDVGEFVQASTPELVQDDGKPGSRNHSRL